MSDAAILVRSSPCANMGGWDAYCALCGALASIPGILDDEPHVEKEDTYDRAVATDEAMAWMDDVRLIGQNDECELPSKCDEFVPVESTARWTNKNLQSLHHWKGTPRRWLLHS